MQEGEMFIKSHILRSPHAFATRRGGVSVQEHTSSLNLAFGRGDEDAVVLQNLELFAQGVGFDARSIVSRPQIHSDRIFTVTRKNRGEGYYIRGGETICERFEPSGAAFCGEIGNRESKAIGGECVENGICTDIENGDGYICGERGVVLGIKTADCTPILFEAERDGEIVAVGAVHAGWRGSVADIAGKCVERLIGEFCVARCNIRAAIGPCIHDCCYEVSEDVFCEVKERLGEDIARRFVIPSASAHEKYMCDLAGINCALLLRHGLRYENIEIIDECTCCHPEKYFSHRYSGGKRGTMLNVIFMNEDR